MSKRNALPVRPLSTWTPEERGLHAAVLAARDALRNGSGSAFADAAAQKEALARLNASLAKRGARCGYTL